MLVLLVWIALKPNPVDYDLATALSRSIGVLVKLSRASGKPIFEEALNKLLEGDVSDLRGYIQNIFSFCNEREGFQIPDHLQCKVHSSKKLTNLAEISEDGMPVLKNILSKIFSTPSLEENASLSMRITGYQKIVMIKKFLIK